jgi:hypothetical protein
MTNLVWPSGLFHCPDPVLRLSGQSQFGGGAIDGGPTQIIDTTAGGFWRVDLDGLHIKGRQNVLALEQWRSLIGSGSQAFILPLYQARSQIAGATPTRTIESDAYPARVSFSASSYAQSITATITANAALRATTLQITCTSVIKGGKVSFVDTGGKWRTHELVVKGAVSGNNQTFEIRPPLRTAVTAGASVYLSHCFLSAVVEPDSFKIDYHPTTKNYARASLKMFEVR